MTMDVTDSTFETAVLERSHTVPVLVAMNKADLRRCAPDQLERLTA